MNQRQLSEIEKRRHRKACFDALQPYFREAIFEEGKIDFSSLGEEEKGKLVDAAIDTNNAPLFLYYFQKHLSTEQKKHLLPFAVHRESYSMLQQNVLYKIRDAMKKANIEFVAIKGADIGFRCYPAPYLRYMCDIDLLFHKRDIEAAQNVLSQLGWKRCGNKDNGYHDGSWKYGKLYLEPHYNISGISQKYSEELWNYVRHTSDGLPVFSPELSFLTIFQHLEKTRWGERDTLRFKLDCAYFLKHEKLNYQKLHDLEEKFNLPDARIFPLAFSDFIPEKLVPTETPVNRDLLETYRYLVTHAGEDFPFDNAKATMIYGKFFLKGSMKTNLYTLTYRGICEKYHLNPKHSHWKYPFYFMLDAVKKLKKLIQHFVFKDREQPKEVVEFINKMKHYRDITKQDSQFAE